MQAYENTTSWPLGRNGADYRRTVRCLRCRPAGPCGSAGHRGRSDLHLDRLLCRWQPRLGLARQQRRACVPDGPGHSGRLGGGTLLFGNSNDGTFTGGGQIGYNYQIGSFVIGAEADIQGIDNGNNNNAVFIPGPGFAGGTFVPGEFEKVRIGGARCACAPVSPSTASWSTPPVVWPTRTTTPAGRLGGGVEWALPVNWFGSTAVTLGLEGLWVSIDQDDDDIIAPSGPLRRLAERRSMCSCRGTMTSRTSSSRAPS